MVSPAFFSGTGRRKTAIARVRLLPEIITTDLLHLLGYAGASFLRMLASYILSLFFAIAVLIMTSTSPGRSGRSFRILGTGSFTCWSASPITVSLPKGWSRLVRKPWAFSHSAICISEYAPVA